MHIENKANVYNRTDKNFFKCVLNFVLNYAI